ncbi:MAG: pyridoxal phosphate-dependent aminotransferase [Acidobacteriota bacterium]
MKLSRRAIKMPASPIRKLHPLAVAAKKKGVDVIHLNIGQPDLATPRQFFETAAQYPSPVLAYSPSQGIPEFIDGLIQYYKQCEMHVEPSQVLATIGGSEAIVMALLAVANPGERVLCFEPFYTNYYSLALTIGVRVDVCSTSIHDGFRLPSEDVIRTALTPKTRAILFCNPNNPTGTVLTCGEIDMLTRIVKDKDIFLIADEVYREFCYDRPFVSIWHQQGLDDRLILVDSLSKRFSACGARLGSILTRNEQLQQTFLRIGQARLSAGTFDQYAAVPFLSLERDYYAGVIEEYRRRRDVLVDGLLRIPGVATRKPEGAFYLLAELPIDDSNRFCAWLLTHFQYQGATVMLAPADGFYLTRGKGKREVRLAYVVNVDRLRVALSILEKALEVYPGRVKPSVAEKELEPVGA